MFSGFRIAVHDRRGVAIFVNVLMGRLQRGGELSHQLQRLTERHGRTAQAFEQRLADQPLHDDEHPTGLVLAAVEDVNHSGVANAGGGAGLVEEAFDPLAIAGQLWQQDLDRALTTELVVAPGVHGSLGSVTENRGDPVAADGLADHGPSVSAPRRETSQVTR